MRFTFNYADKYNWDAGKSVTIFGRTVADTTLGRLHQVGIAQEYLMSGKARLAVEWEKGERFDIATGELKKKRER